MLSGNPVPAGGAYRVRELRLHADRYAPVCLVFCGLDGILDEVCEDLVKVVRVYPDPAVVPDVETAPEAAAGKSVGDGFVLPYVIREIDAALENAVPENAVPETVQVLRRVDRSPGYVVQQFNLFPDVGVNGVLVRPGLEYQGDARHDIDDIVQLVAIHALVRYCLSSCHLCSFQCFRTQGHTVRSCPGIASRRIWNLP